MSKRKKQYDDEDEQSAADQPYVSRSDRTRASKAVNKIGLRLAEFPPHILDKLDLPEELREAIDLCQSLNIKSSRRQQRVVCQLLRDEDHETIASRIQALNISRGVHKS